MRNPEYFWKDGQVVSHDFEGLDLKAPVLIEHGLVECTVVDTNSSPNGWGRIGWYVPADNEYNITWREGTHDDLSAEFKTALLLLGVQP